MTLFLVTLKFQTFHNIVFICRYAVPTRSVTEKPWTDTWTKTRGHTEKHTYTDRHRRWWGRTRETGQRDKERHTERDREWEMER